ncbi:MAG: hypothetical protein V4594_18385 [Bacteroidota bacterium]
MVDLNCSSIIKENPGVLSWNDDIFVMHYRQPLEIKMANMFVHMNLISIVLKGIKEKLDHGSKLIVPAGSGFFMKKGSYVVSDKVDDPDNRYESIIIIFSDAWLRSQAYSILACSGGASSGIHACRDMGLLPKDDMMNI